MTQTQPYGPPAPVALNYARRASLWAPPPGVLSHGEAPIPADAEFFVPPPPQIGAVQSAATTLTLSKGPWPVAARLGLGFGVTVAVAALAAWIIGSNSRGGFGSVDPLVIGVLFAVGGGGGVGLTVLVDPVQQPRTDVRETGGAP